MNMKFYMTPGSCTTGIHILLEELELIFEAYLVNLMAGDQHKPDYLALNPKGTIPTLVLTDGNPLTDFCSIALWLAKTYPKKQLIPDDLYGEMKNIEQLNYVIHFIHGEGFTRIFTTDKYSDKTDEHEAIKQKGQELVTKGFNLVNTWLTGSQFLADQFSIADAALFYVEFWAVRIDIPLPENCLKHYQTMLQRPAVRMVLAEEGYSSVLQ